MVLADSSVWIAYFRGEARAVSRFEALTDASELMTCGPVVAELLAGVQHREDREDLWDLLIAIPWAAIDAAHWRSAGEAAANLAASGRSVPLTDLVIGVAAARARATLWTYDSDFERVAEVATGLDLLVAS